MDTQDARPPLIARETELDHEGSAAREATSTESALGLALSGGGVRAALFSLGVVIGLIEMGCHRRVRCVASVSGGSILNAALAHARSLGSFSTVEEFHPLASRLAGRLASRGAFAFDLRRLPSALRKSVPVVLGALPPLAILLGTLADSLRATWGFNLADLDLSKVPWLLVGLITLASVSLSVFLTRGRLQQAEYDSVLKAVAESSSGPLYVRDWGPISAGDESGVMHVLVATDLLSGEPMYFSRQFVHCRSYGWSDPGQIRTAEALYSSAAFPAVFPPKWLWLRRLDFQNGVMKGALPTAARLADGGVYNNLGNDWFNVLKEQLEQLGSWRFGELKVNAPRIKTENVVVVNAGAPSSRVRWLAPFTTVVRIMSVLYDNTVRPRVQAIQSKNHPLIDIVESPIQLAQRLEREDRDAASRATAVVTRLKDRDEKFWADFSSDTAGTKTKLTRVERREGARLMLHGYLSSLVLFHVRFEAKLPERIRGEEYFLSLIPRSWSFWSSLSAASAPK